MNCRYKLLTILFFTLYTAGFGQHAGQRVLFNTGWKFNKGEATGADKTNYDDAAWRQVELPHDWSVEGPFSNEWASATAYLPGGIGWYRKTFTIPADWKTKKVSIYFDGVYKNSEVWINNHYLGKRPNGFTPFQYELSPYLDASGKNTISVKVNHEDFADSRWYTGSGIYRNVYLIATSASHIDQWGVAFTTPQVTTESAKANVAVSIVNGTRTGEALSVKCTLNDKAGKQVAVVERKVNATVGQTSPVNLSFRISKPTLWSIENPYLYTLRVAVVSEGKQLDEWVEKVGVRAIKFTPNEGFALNGVNTKLKGVCVHDDAGVLGVAVPKEVWIRRLRALKEGGTNSLRMGHNPHADYLYELCDEMGFVVMDEAFDEWESGKNKWIKGWNKGEPGKDGYNKDFKEWADRDLKDMILRNRNHPSIIMWSIGNEIDYPNDPYSHEILNTGNNPQIYGKGYLPNHPPASRLGEISKHLVAVAKTYDTSRPITAALAGVVMSNTTSYPENLDVVGYNYQEYRYPEDHKNYPNRIIYGSENGMQLNAWKAVDTNNYISAQYLWTGIDYLGEAGVFPNRSNTAGLINLGGFPKPEYFFRQSLWSAKPMIYIGTSSIPKGEDRGIWSHKRATPVWSGKTGDSVRVNCFTNCTEAELFLNGSSLGRKKLAGAANKVLSWDMAYQPGELIVKGFNDEKEVSADTLATTGTAAAISAHVYSDGLIDARSGLKQIEVRLTDDKGRLVYAADNELTVEVSGDAKLLGLENSNPNMVDDYKSNKRKAMNGSMIIYVQPGKSKKAFQVNITSPGLQPASLQF